MKDMTPQIEEITDKESLLRFMAKLIDDYRGNSGAWENTSIDGYLASIMSWIEDSPSSEEGGIEWNKTDCSLIAKLLYMGKIYE